MGSTRVIPQTLLPAELRQDALQKRRRPLINNAIKTRSTFVFSHALLSALPSMMQSRKMLTHGPRSIAQPAWQLLCCEDIP